MVLKDTEWYSIVFSGIPLALFVRVADGAVLAVLETRDVLRLALKTAFNTVDMRRRTASFTASGTHAKCDR